MAHSSSYSRKSHLQIEVVKVNKEKELHKHIKRGVYTGGTLHPESRSKQHERNFKHDLSGRRFMYCWKTHTSMKSAENRILKLGYFPLNSHNVSNADDKPGYVYIIV